MNRQNSYRRSKFLIDGFRNYTSRILPRNPPQPPTSRIIHTTSATCESSNTNNKISGFPWLLLSSPILRKHGWEHAYNQNLRLFGGARRYYYVDRYRVRHFRPRGPEKWFQNPKAAIALVLLGSGVVATVYYGNLETIPYTKRTHFVLLSRSLEKQLGEVQFEKMKAGVKGKILPAIHPDSVRVRLIAKDVIGALKRGLRQDQVWTDPGYAQVSPGMVGNEGVMFLKDGREYKMEGSWAKEDEILDDKWVQESRKKSHDRGWLPTTGHLEGLNWEVVVVDAPVVNALCLPGGKIIVFTGLLRHFRTDTEIATIIGHEVGHAVARHVAETITRHMWLFILQLILYQFIMPDLVNTMSNLLLRLPFSRRMEIEADYIGLLLAASAGYDPGEAPKVYEKLGQLTGESSLRDYLSTHPSGKKRAKLLAQANVMKEARAIYREVTAGRGVEGFLYDHASVIP